MRVVEEPKAAEVIEPSDLIKVEEINAVELFTGGGVNELIAKIQQAVRKHVPDISTDVGRKAVASLSRKVSSAKVLVDNLGKEQVAEWKAKAAKVDAGRQLPGRQTVLPGGQQDRVTAEAKPQTLRQIDRIVAEALAAGDIPWSSTGAGATPTGTAWAARSAPASAGRPWPPTATTVRNETPRSHESARPADAARLPAAGPPDVAR